mgnify:CR=1 FL=1
MTYGVSNLAGAQPIANTSTVQAHLLGTIVKGQDPIYGEGEFIYLLGVASTIVGSLVTYNATTYQTALTTHVPVQARPVAVSMSANVGAQYGWYQIEGLAVIKKTAVLFGAQVTIALSATSGRVKGTSTSGMQIGNARSANLATISATVSVITALINRPFLQTQIT